MKPVLAWLDARRQLRVLDAEGQVHHHGGGDPQLLWGAWSSATPTRVACSWPTWSPDAGHIACFVVHNDEALDPRVAVFDAAGVSGAELVSLGERLPIYLQWSQDGTRLALLAQRDDRLWLSTLRPDRVGEEVHLADGSPMFFTWAGERLAAFVGNGEVLGGTLSLIDPSGRPPVHVLPGTPGHFCAPVWLGDRLLYVASQGGPPAVVWARQGDAEAHVLEQVDGLVALLASPDGRWVARAVAPEGDGTPYRRLALLDPASGEVRPLHDAPCLAFCWSPAGDALIVVRVDTDRNLLVWERLDLDGKIHPIVESVPTRDLGFYLRFFEQYTQSHPLVDATGQHLVLAGGVLGQPDPHGTPRIWRVGLADGRAEELDQGVFGVWAPPG